MHEKKKPQTKEENKLLKEKVKKLENLFRILMDNNSIEVNSSEGKINIGKEERLHLIEGLVSTFIGIGKLFDTSISEKDWYKNSELYKNINWSTIK